MNTEGLGQKMRTNWESFNQSIQKQTITHSTEPYTVQGLNMNLELLTKFFSGKMQDKRQNHVIPNYFMPVKTIKKEEKKIKCKHIHNVKPLVSPYKPGFPN